MIRYKVKKRKWLRQFSLFCILNYLCAPIEIKMNFAVIFKNKQNYFTSPLGAWGSVLIVFLFFSCAPKQAEKSSNVAADSLQLQYAEGFAVLYHHNYKEVIVYSPWKKGEIYARYFLVNDKNTKIPTNGSKVLVPIQSLAATSVTHFEFLSLLGEINSLSAVCSPHLIYNKAVLKKINDGKLADLGDAFNVNVEKTLQLKPEAVMMSGYNQNDPYSQRVSQAGIPVIINVEWMEKSLLARAEWIKFVAAFYNKEKMADNIFAEISTRYENTKAKAAKVSVKPRIVAGNSFRGTWYMPAGRNYMAKLYADAGAEYFYSNDTTTGSLPLNVETVLKNFSDCDVWLNCNFNSLKELQNADAKHTLFKAFKQKQVYNFNNRLLSSSANDFWESAVARPDLLLSDVIAILHPELLPGYKFTYAKKLE